jgi:3-oxoacyl-[acyl-carrier protein] reductase
LLRASVRRCEDPGVPVPSLPHRIAIVTGAASGIGRATALRLVSDGFRVVATDIAPVDLDGAHGVAADLADPAAVPALFDAAERTFGPVDVLVHSATASLLDTFVQADEDWAGRATRRVDAASFDRQFAVDARAGALLIAAFTARLEARSERGGRIVVLTSGGEVGFPGEVSYGAAKAALVHYALSASIELNRYGVAVNAVHPPITDTGWVTEEVERFVAADPRFFDVAKPEEIAAVIAYLVSPDGGRITGTTVRMG